MNGKIKDFVIGASLASLLTAPVLAAGEGHEHEQGATSEMSDDMATMHREMEMKMAETAAFGMKGDPAQAARTVNVEATEMQFDLTKLSVAVGETVRFVIRNLGEQPHEFTIGDAAYQENARAIMAHMSEMGMDMMAPQHLAMHVATGNTVVVSPGETKEIVWTFTKPGTFEFSCNFVGHAEVGMQGTISVS